MENIKCKICGLNIYQKDTTAYTYNIKEMMMGTKEEFKYLECPHCKSLQLIDIPKDMGKYYDQNYYSLENPSAFVKKQFYHLNKYYLDKDLIGQFLDKIVDGNEKIYKLIKYLLDNNNINCSSQILDIGCGSGFFLELLSDLGFSNLNGMEPFIKEQINAENFTIFKSFLDEFNPKKIL